MAPTHDTWSVGERLRDNLFAENGKSISARFRARRWEVLLNRFPALSDMRVIDLGGTALNWQKAPVAPASVTVVNLEPEAREGRPDWVSTELADACALPPEILEAGFDLVFSNSLIEHVGGPFRRRALADAVHRLAPHHWIQTPARSFPLEPHWLFPGFQYLPLPARVAISRRWPFGPPWFRDRSEAEAVDDVLGTELLTPVEMRRLFPGSEIYKERFAGVTKALVAVR